MKRLGKKCFKKWKNKLFIIMERRIYLLFLYTEMKYFNFICIDVLLLVTSNCMNDSRDTS